MNEHHYQRIDKGIERKQIRREARQQPRSSKGVFLPICSADRRSEIILSIPERIKNGETTREIAAAEGLAWSTLKSWLVGLPEVEDARGLFLAQELVSRADDIDLAKEAGDPLALACARESFRAWSWIAERREARLFGQRQEITHVSVDLGDRLRRAQERVINQAPIDALPNTGVMSNPQEAQTIQALPEPKDPDQKK
jgi:hypothetical protein